MDFSANLELPFILPNQAQKHVTANETIRAVDVLMQLRIKTRTLSGPPDHPVEGESYLLPDVPAGEWASYPRALAHFQDGAWAYRNPQAGWLGWLEDEDRLIIFDGVIWKDHRLTKPLDAFAINAQTDPANVLLVKGETSLFDAEDGDHRLKINRVTGVDTSSLIFQTGYLGQVELGLVGTDMFSVKVSENGLDFGTAMNINLASGYAGFGADEPLSALHVGQEIDARLTIETKQPGTGGGFDIINSGDQQRWRVTGQAELFKLRDHTAGLDKLVLFGGPEGDVHFRNCRHIGIGTQSPRAELDVNGAVRVGQYSMSALPSAVALGAGAIIYVTDAAGGATLAISDGSIWGKVSMSPL